VIARRGAPYSDEEKPPSGREQRPPGTRLSRVDAENAARSPSAATDLVEIEDIVRAFFAAFTSGPESSTRLDDLRSLFLPGALVVRTCGTEPVLYSVEGFIAPREALLSGGTLVDFREWPVSGRTDLFGDVAHWFGTYAKAWEQDGTPFSGRGMKSLQFVRTREGWRISAAAWDDEREGVTIRNG
jgi:hypothetical protein